MYLVKRMRLVVCVVQLYIHVMVDSAWLQSFGWILLPLMLHPVNCREPEVFGKCDWPRGSYGITTSKYDEPIICEKK